MKIPLALFPTWTRTKYNLDEHIHKGCVYLEIFKVICGPSHADRLANERLRKKLESAGFYEGPHTPGLWKYRRRPVQFSLIMDNCWVIYVGKEHIDYLINIFANIIHA